MKIIAIIVTYNGKKWLKNCFGSLLSSKIPIQIIAIDNSSDDGTPDAIKNEFPGIKLILNKDNIGFGKANNIGLKMVLDENIDYAFLLNQDAWIESDTISKLISIHQRYPKYGILSPLHLSGDKRNLDSAFTNYINGYSCPYIISDYFLQREKKEVYETNFVNAAFWLISKECIRKVGGFDPLFIHYGEDEDYLSRVKYHGMKVGICPEAIGYHDRKQTLIDINNWSSERIFCSNLIKLKNLSLTLPPKIVFKRSILKLKLSSLIENRDKGKQISINQLILRSYNQIIANRFVCQQIGPSFLNE